MALTIEELKEKLATECDPDELVEQLELSTSDLLDAFTDRVIDNAYKFEEFSDDADGG